MIKFKNVSMLYDNNVKALADVNISIDSGEFVFLVGPSGSGKSTFIKMLIKEVDPTVGEVFLWQELNFLVLLENKFHITEERLEWFFKILDLYQL